jgi:hypothetical protein
MTRGLQHELSDQRLSAALAGYRTVLAPGSVLALSGWVEPADDRGRSRTIERLWHT